MRRLLASRVWPQNSACRISLAAKKSSRMQRPIVTQAERSKTAPTVVRHKRILARSIHGYEARPIPSAVRARHKSKRSSRRVQPITHQRTIAFGQFIHRIKKRQLWMHRQIAWVSRSRRNLNVAQLAGSLTPLRAKDSLVRAATQQHPFGMLLRSRNRTRQRTHCKRQRRSRGKELPSTREQGHRAYIVSATVFGSPGSLKSNSAGCASRSITGRLGRFAVWPTSATTVATSCSTSSRLIVYSSRPLS